VPKLGRILAELVLCVEMYRYHSRAVVAATILAMIGHVGFVSSFYFCAVSVNAGKEVPSLQAQFLLLPIGFVVQAVPLTPGGNLGVGEVVFQNLFEYKVGKEDAIAGFLACVAQRVVGWAVALIGLLCYLPLRPAIRKEYLEHTKAEPPVKEGSSATAPTGNGQAAISSQPTDIDHEAVPQ
jgi:uncharacterized membrane protein YbhN (UPF0104 family)